VDVRDVADIHIKVMALTQANGQRYLATSDGAVSFYDVAELIKKERPEDASLIADQQLTAVEAYTRMSNKKAVETFNWHPRSKEEAILVGIRKRSTGRFADIYRAKRFKNHWATFPVQ